jgi:hypothetical protein
MDAIRGTVKSGRLELETLLDWPDGTEVRVELTLIPPEGMGINESAWRDDADSLADWESWIKTIEPLEFTPDEVARNAKFDERMSHFNVEAVRRQMQHRADG